MKKIFLTLAVLIGSFGAARAEMIADFPEGPPQAIGFADFVGVDMSTVSFSSATQTLLPYTTGAYILVYGVCFSSGSSTDYVALRDTTTLADTGYPNQTQEQFRLYNVASATQSVGSPGLSAGSTFLKYPVVFKKGLLWNVSTTTYNSVALFIRRRRIP